MIGKLRKSSREGNTESSVTVCCWACACAEVLAIAAGRCTPLNDNNYASVTVRCWACACAEVLAIAAGRCTPLNDNNYAWASGTSMAVPHVAGAAAIYLSQNPNAAPAQVSHAIAGASTSGPLKTDGMLPGTPNKLLLIGSNSM